MGRQKLSPVDESLLLPTADPEAVVCAEPGRQMAYRYVLRYFLGRIKVAPQPLGTACSICGATDRQLYGDKRVCRAQIAIASKRDTWDPVKDGPRPGARDNSSGGTCIAEGNIVIAGPHVARIVTKVAPAQDLPDELEIAYPTEKEGVAAKALAALLRDPPAPPYVVMVTGKNASYPVGVNFGRGVVQISGPDGHQVDRAVADRLVASLQGLSASEVKKVRRMRSLLSAGPDRSKKDTDELNRFRAANPRIGSLLFEMPSGTSEEFKLAEKIASQVVDPVEDTGTDAA